MMITGRLMFVVRCSSCLFGLKVSMSLIILNAHLQEKSSFGSFESITTLLTSGADIFFKINFFNEKGQDHHGPALKTTSEFLILCLVLSANVIAQVINQHVLLGDG
jgi:hypothetical protein